MDGICKLGDFGLVIDLATGGEDGEFVDTMMYNTVYIARYGGRSLLPCP